MAYVTQQLIKTTEGWVAFDALGKPVPKDYWLFERVTETEGDATRTYYKFKISDGVHLFAGLPYQLLNGNSARISADGYWEIFNDGTQQYDKTTFKALGVDGKSAYEVWQSQPGNADKTVEQYLASLRGDPFTFADFTPEQLEQLKGESAYQIWLTQPGNEGKTVEEFIASLKGNTGAAFTYDMFTPEQLEGLKGQDGVISEDAPADGKTYGRKDEGWAEVETKPLFLNLDLLFDAEGNPVASVTDEFIPQMVEAYTNKVDIAVMGGGYYPLMIKKGSGENDYQLSISIIDVAGPVASGNNDAIIVAYFFEVNSTSKSLKFGVSSARIAVSGDGTKALMDNGMYKKVVLFTPITTVTTLTDLPVTNYSIKATLSAASPISFASAPAEGEEYMIDILNSGSADFDQPLPNADNCQSNETSVTCPAGKVTAISVRYIHGKYVFRV